MSTSRSLDTLTPPVGGAGPLAGVDSPPFHSRLMARDDRASVHRGRPAPAKIGLARPDSIGVLLAVVLAGDFRLPFSLHDLQPRDGSSARGRDQPDMGRRFIPTG